MLDAAGTVQKTSRFSIMTPTGWPELDTMANFCIFCILGSEKTHFVEQFLGSGYSIGRPTPHYDSDDMTVM